MTRDEFLTEKMGECWHEWRTETQKKGYVRNVCLKCGIIQGDGDYPNFSTWEDFGKLWEKCISSKKKWLSEFMNWWALQFPSGWEAWLKWERLSPDERSDAVAKYLGWGEGGVVSSPPSLASL